MKAISAHMTPGEFFDRFTIDLRKAEFDTRHYGPKVLDHMAEMVDLGCKPDLLRLVALLMMHNTDIWNLEADVRKGKEGELGLAEVGQRALKIRDINAKRIACVNAINELFGVNEKETKFDHASS